jgi:hypothetical protein
MPCAYHYGHPGRRHHCRAAPEIVIVFGVAFIPAGSLLALLIVGAVANAMFTVVDRHDRRWASGLNGTLHRPLIPLAWLATVMIPRLANSEPRSSRIVGCPYWCVCCPRAYPRCKVWLLGTFLRSVFIALVLGAVSILWPTQGCSCQAACSGWLVSWAAGGRGVSPR